MDLREIKIRKGGKIRNRIDVDWIKVAQDGTNVGLL
jgi:hypothetical protein